MKFQLLSDANPNYVGSLVRISHLRPHTNADKLQIATIFGNSVVVGTDIVVGDYGMFFPLESQLQPKFLSQYNLYRNETLNSDVNKKGFFEENGRVRAVKLRGEKSEGIFIHIDKNDLFGAKDLEFKPPFKDTPYDFNLIDGDLIVKKYIIKNSQIQGSGKTKSDRKIVKKFNRIVENQFRLHVDTEQLKKNIHKLNLDDYIGVHYKKHGTSWVVGNVLTNKVPTWKDRIAKFFGIPVEDKEYGVIYSSRKVIKNQYINPEQKNGYYDYDLWKDIADNLGDRIPKGWTLYGEAVGYLPTGGMIQAPFDYGCEPGIYKIYVYRITVTNSDGKIIELDDKQIEEFCEKNGLLYKDTFMYYGTVKDHINELSLEIIGQEILSPSENRTELVKLVENLAEDVDNNDDRWRDGYITLLVKKYNDKDCYMCANSVPEEGVVIRKQKLFDYDAFKLKSFRFLEKETKDLDKGIISIEDEQAS